MGIHYIIIMKPQHAGLWGHFPLVFSPRSLCRQVHSTWDPLKSTALCLSSTFLPSFLPCPANRRITCQAGAVPANAWLLSFVPHYPEVRGFTLSAYASLLPCSLCFCWQICMVTCQGNISIILLLQKLKAAVSWNPCCEDCLIGVLICCKFNI